MLRIVPASREQVATFIALHHRHHRPPVGDVFRLACVDEDGVVRGVASVGRPVARRYDDGMTLEVNRVATDGARNACSLLYGAARRVAFGLGYRRIVTYTLPEEGGASLRGAGWTCDGEFAGPAAGWLSRAGRSDAIPGGGKVRWVAVNDRAFDGEVAWPDAPDDTQIYLFDEEAS